MAIPNIVLSAVLCSDNPRRFVCIQLGEHSVMAKSKQADLTFEKGLDDLESIVEKLENAELPLEESLALFEKGVELSEACRTRLEEAETRIEILLRKGRKIEAEPFELDDSGDGE